MDEEDPTLANAGNPADIYSDDAITAYRLMERALCTCDPDAGLDTCGWDQQ